MMVRRKYEPRKHYGNAKALAGMAIWRKLGGAPSIRERTDKQCGWDSALLAVSEYLRRLHNRDFPECLDLLTPVPGHQADELLIPEVAPFSRWPESGSKGEE